MAVIGAGPAGITAAIYAKRKNLGIRLFDKKIAGGYVADAVLLENYTGFEAIKGIELARKMQQHARAQGIEIEEGTGVKHARKSGDKFELELGGGKKLQARVIILATGTTHRHLNVPGEKELQGKGVAYCATCDGPLFKGKKVAVIGGGNSGATNALFLADICEKVFLVEFSPRLKCDDVYRKRLAEKKNIEVLTGTRTTRILGETAVEGIEVEPAKGGEKKTIDCSAVFVYAGMLPQSSLAKELGCRVNEHGYIETGRDHSTSVPGVFAAGDVTGAFAQAIVAAGQGAIAAEAAYNFLQKKRRESA